MAAGRKETLPVSYEWRLAGRTRFLSATPPSLDVAAASFNKCRKIHELEGDNDIPDREWQTPERGRQSSHAAALGIAGEYSADRDEVRVRAGAVRCLYRASRRQG